MVYRACPDVHPLSALSGDFLPHSLPPWCSSQSFVGKAFKSQVSAIGPIGPFSSTSGMIHPNHETSPVFFQVFSMFAVEQLQQPIERFPPVSTIFIWETQPGGHHPPGRALKDRLNKKEKQISSWLRLPKNHGLRWFTRWSDQPSYHSAHPVLWPIPIHGLLQGLLDPHQSVLQQPLLGLRAKKYPFEAAVPPVIGDWKQWPPRPARILKKWPRKTPTMKGV